MVDVSEKKETSRIAEATGAVYMLPKTLELIENAKHLIDTFYKKGLTYAEAMESVVNYRYDDDCINEGVAKMWEDYCKEHNIWKD